MDTAVPILCPSCSSPEVTLRAVSRYECAHCGTSFILGPAGGREAQKDKVRLAVLLFLAAAVVAVVVARASRPREPGGGTEPPVGRNPASRWVEPFAPPASPTLPTPPPVSPPRSVFVQPAQDAPEPRAELRSMRRGTTVVGGMFWLGSYANVGEVAIARPAARASLFDSDGARVAEQVGFAHVEVLEPGAEFPVLVLFAEPPQHAHAREELVVVAPRPVNLFASRQIAATVAGVSEQRERTSLRLVGTVENRTESVFRYVNVIAIGRDAQGAPVSIANQHATEPNLAPGASSGFSVRCGVFELEPPARWEVVALGVP